MAVVIKKKLQKIINRKDNTYDVTISIKNKTVCEYVSASMSMRFSF